MTSQSKQISASELNHARKALKLLKEKRQIPNENLNPIFGNTKENQQNQNKKYRKKFNVDDTNQEVDNKIPIVKPTKPSKPVAVKNTKAVKDNKFDYKFEDGDAQDEPPVVQKPKVEEDPPRKKKKDVFQSEEEEVKTIERQPCKHCGRKFAADALEKHEPKCEQVFLKKRKQFNAADKRIVSNEQENIKKEAPQVSSKPKKSKMPKWKQQSEQFRRAVGKTTTADGKPQANDFVDVDRTECQYCGRSFNEDAAKKHIPFCKNKSEMDKMKATSKRKPMPSKKKY